jgi:TetR/AcrR family transcriptional repressor of nem operon
MIIDFCTRTYILVGMLAESNSPRRATANKRNPERTRELLLQATFQEVYKSGFQGADLGTILGVAGVTKGALYHHFDSKETLGYAVVDEVIAGITLEKWLLPLQNAKDPIDTLVHIVGSTSLKPEHLRGGCPLNNLSQEMSPLDEGFRTRLAKVFSDWRGGIATALRKGQKHGLVRRDIDPNETATYLIATYEGYLSLAKNSQDAKVLESGKKRMVRFLASLRAESKVSPS